MKEQSVWVQNLNSTVQQFHIQLYKIIIVSLQVL